MSQWFRKYNLIGWFLCLFCFHNVYAESPFEHANAVNFPKVLSADEAFDLSYTYRGTTLDLSWKIAPQCYLYRESIKVFIHQQNQALLPLLNEASLPSGKTVHDPALGEQVVYTDRLDLSIDLSSVLTDTKQNPLVIEVEYQGCSENGFCYPPMSKTFNITSHSKKIENILPQEESVENKSVENQSKMPTSYLAIIATFYVFGLLLSFTPCVLPMIPILFVVIVGQGHLNTRRAFGVSLCYVLSMAFTYAIAGIIVATLGKNLQATMQKPLVLILFSAFFIYLGLVQLGIGKINMPAKWRDWLHQSHTKQTGGTYIGAAIMGVLATLIASPCVSAPMMGALLYISQSNDIFLGGSALFALGLGMGTLLIVIGTLEGKLLPKKGPWMHTINQIFALILFGLSIWLLDRLLPGPITLALWGLLLLLASYWMGTFSLQPNRSGRFGSILVVLAALLFWGSWNGADNPLNPFYIDGWHLSSTSPTSTDKQFTVIDSLNGLAEQQAMAQKQQKPLLVMIHADWCVSCKRFEHAVLAQTDIKQKLTNWNTVAANITKYDEDDQLIMKKFDLVGPPVVLFFDQNGNELTKYRVVGEISHEDFAKRLEEMNKELHLS